MLFQAGSTREVAAMAAQSYHATHAQEAANDGGILDGLGNVAAKLGDPVDWTDAPLIDAARWFAENAAFTVTVAVLSYLTVRNVSKRLDAGTPLQEVNALAVLGRLRTAAGQPLTPLQTLLDHVPSKNIWCEGLPPVNTAHYPASMVLRGMPVTFSGDKGFQEQLLLDLAEVATGKRYESIADMHGDFASVQSKKGSGYAIRAPGNDGGWQLVMLKGSGSPATLSDTANPRGYYFCAGGYYVRVKPHNRQDSHDSVTVQISRRRPAGSDMRPRDRRPLTSHKGPLGIVAGRTHMHINVSTPKAA